MRQKLIIAGLAGLLALAGCSTGPAYETGESPFGTTVEFDVRDYPDATLADDGYVRVYVDQHVVCHADTLRDLNDGDERDCVESASRTHDVLVSIGYYDESQVDDHDPDYGHDHDYEHNASAANS